MAELKPRLIITSSGKKRRGFGTFIMVLLIFAAGFYTGTKYGDYLFGAGPLDETAQKEEPVSTFEEQTISGEQEIPESENRDIVYSGETQVAGVQKSLADEELFGDKVLEDTASSQSDDPDGVGQMLIMGDTDNAPQEVLASNNVTDEPDNEYDTVIETAPKQGSSYTLQVGAFSTSDEARAVADGYKFKGYKAYIVPIENSRGEKWNLVKIGKFNTIDQAWSYASYFKNREGQDAYVETVEQGTVFNESWSQQEISDQQ